MEVPNNLDDYRYDVDQVILNTDGELMDLEGYLQLYASVVDFPSSRTLKAFYGEDFESEYRA